MAEDSAGAQSENWNDDVPAPAAPITQPAATPAFQTGDWAAQVFDDS